MAVLCPSWGWELCSWAGPISSSIISCPAPDLKAGEDPSVTPRDAQRSRASDGNTAAMGGGGGGGGKGGRGEGGGWPTHRVY